MSLQRPATLKITVAIVLLALGASRAADDPGDIDFFEKKIRPVLAEHCYKCHSAKSEKIKGKLRVDSRNGLLKGGDAGPSLVPGSPDKSLLIEAVLYKNPDLQMPPKEKLRDEVIEDLTAWVKKGGRWPDEKEAQPIAVEKTLDYEKLRKEHWAFRPVQTAPAPAVKDAAWPAGAIDHFVLSKLEQKALKPAPPADKLALMRRVSFDLTGLPPSPEQMDSFLKDDSAGAFPKVVDALLASPHFGERWGRHWLDIARYAESAGGGRIVPLNNAWRYRDYVIDAFSKDKPYNQFITEQLAGDLLPAETPQQRAEQIVATGFLAIGPKNLDTQDKDLLRMDVVDEQMDTLGKAMLGMTIGCARCHDHKFDPIPTRDYYAMAGIFRSTKTLTPGNVSGVVQAGLPSDPATSEKVARYEKALAAIEARIHAFNTTVALKPVVASPKSASAPAKARSKVDAATLPGIVLDDSQANIIGTWIKSTHTQVFVGESYIHDNSKSKGEMSVSYSPTIPKAGHYEVRMSYSHANTRSTRVPVIIQHAEGEKTVEVNEVLEPPIDGMFVSLGTFLFSQGNDNSVTVSNMGTKGVVTVDAVQFISVDEKTEPKTKSPLEKPPLAVPPSATVTSKSGPESDKAQLKKLEDELKEFKKSAPPVPSALAVREEEQVDDYNVCVRGDVHRLGEPVPRGFLSVVSFAPPVIAGKQSGRVELAQWVTDPRNPLTARVLVNRVWHHLFGAGIVRSTDNFGTTGETPSNLELLDYLATRFVENGWSTKKIIREIVLSRTYQTASVISTDAKRIDPENRLCSHASHRRLDVEAIRDAMLWNSGQLDLTPAPDYLTISAPEKSKTLRRTVYLSVERETIDGMLEVFDFADPNLVVGTRSTSTLPTQALFLMNSPFTVQQGRAAAERLLNDSNLDDAARIALAYRRALGRLPSAAEQEMSMKFLSGAAAGKEKLNAWAQFYQALFACVDFRYRD